MSKDKITKESIDKASLDFLQYSAEQYVMQIPVDYGDLKEKAELQIKEAFIAGATHAQITSYFERGYFMPTSEIRALICNETIVGYEQKWIDKKGNVQWQQIVINTNFIKQPHP